MTTITARVIRERQQERHLRRSRRRATLGQVVVTVLIVAVGLTAAWLIRAQGVTIARQAAAQQATTAQLTATQKDLIVKLKDIRQLAQQRRDLQGRVDTWKQLSGDQFTCSMGLVSALQAAEDEDWQRVSDLLHGQAAGCSDAFGRYGDLIGEQDQSPGPVVPDPAPAPDTQAT